MALQLSMAFDGGAETFTRVLDKGSEAIKDLSPFFRNVIAYFEGKGNTKSSIQTIYEEEGHPIGGEWSLTSAKYAAWKEKHWSEERVYDVGNDRNALQILTGATLYSLQESNAPKAVRTINPMSMVYGTSVPYAEYNQEKRKILDFFPQMETDISRIFRLYLHDIAPELDEGGDKV